MTAAGMYGQTTMKHVALSIALAFFPVTTSAAAEEAQSFPKDQIATGAELYAVNCAKVFILAIKQPDGTLQGRAWRSVGME